MIPETDLNNRVQIRWSHEEQLIAVQAIRKFGKDFNTIAEIIGTKTEGHVRTFYANFRRRYNLDDIVKEYELENGIVHSNDSSENKMDVSSSSMSSGINDTTESIETSTPILSKTLSSKSVISKISSTTKL